MEILRAIDMNEEDEIKEMQNRQRELHLIPTPICYLDVEVMNKNGEIVSKYSDRSKSWVRNFYNFCVMQQMGIGPGKLGTSFGAGYLTMKDTGGNIKDASSSYTIRMEAVGAGYGFIGNAGSVVNGIVIGTGETAESLNDYVLGAIIAEGTDSGQMNYAGMSITNPVWDGTGKTMTRALERTMVNNSGSSITVKEIGLIGYMIYNTSNNGKFLLARDVLSTPVAVAHESQIKVTYTIQIAYPS